MKLISLFEKQDTRTNKNAFMTYQQPKHLEATSKIVTGVEK